MPRINKMSRWFFLGSALFAGGSIFSWMLYFFSREGELIFFGCVLPAYTLICIGMGLWDNEDRAEAFESKFGFDPRKPDLVEDPQDVVSSMFQQLGEIAREFFEKEERLRNRKQEVTLYFLQLKGDSKENFWDAVMKAKLWGFQVPTSINQKLRPLR